jgi:erythromycin esterase
MTDKQSFTDWFGSRAIAAESLDPRAPLDDLEPLGELVGDARVVGIGESAHYVREFYLLRHRLLRFLVQRCGFTVYTPEAPFTQARAIDAWIQGGPGTVEEVAAAGVAIDLGRCREFHDQLAWMRAHKHTATRRLRLSGPTCPAPAAPRYRPWRRWPPTCAAPTPTRCRWPSRRSTWCAATTTPPPSRRWAATPPWTPPSRMR